MKYVFVYDLYNTCINYFNAFIIIFFSGQTGSGKTHTMLGMYFYCRPLIKHYMSKRFL